MQRSLSRDSDTKALDVGGHGLVPTVQVMPNPLNPRKYFDPAETAMLSDSIKHGGQREIAVVRLATDAESEQHPGVLYVLTSGERRYWATLEAGLELLEVRVKTYGSTAEEMLDLYMLNENRRPLSDLENAEYIAQLAEKWGWETQEEIAAGIGNTQVYVSRMLAVTRCAPSVKARMSPKIDESKCFGVQVAVLFSKLAPDVQDDLVARMPEDCTTGVAQAAWIRSQLEEKEIELPSRERSPVHMRRMLNAFAKTICTKTRDINKGDELSRLFENTTDAAAKVLAVDLRAALGDFERLVARVETLAGMEKRATTLVSSDATRSPANRPVAPMRASAPKERLAPAQPARQAVPKPVAQPSWTDSSAVAQSASLAMAKAMKNGAQLRVEFWDPSSRRIAIAQVDKTRYIALWKAKHLAFQINKKPKPHNYPDLADLEETAET